MTSYEGSRQFLQKESSDGVSLYSHLANVLLKVRQQPEQVLAMLSSGSELLCVACHSGVHAVKAVYFEDTGSYV